ncbi:MAG: glucokinase [Candidatus Nanoarchaeia archaeon]
MNIVPTLFSQHFEEMNEQYNKLSNYFSYFHIDIMTPDFIEHIQNNISVHQLDVLLSQLSNNSHTCEIHFMSRSTTHYEEVLHTYHSQIHSIIIHFEAFESSEEIEHFVEEFKSNHPQILLQLAISPTTQIETTLPVLSLFHQIMIMGVNPGKQGQELLEHRLNSATILQKFGIKHISIDGGVSEKTISTIIKYPFSQINVGSYINASDNIERNVLQLQEKIKEHDEYNNTNESKHSKLNILICDVGGTYTKYYLGDIEDFSTQHITKVKTSTFTSSKQLLKSIIGTIPLQYIILSIAGENHHNSIKMTHQNLYFNYHDICEQYSGAEVKLYNDIELAAYGLQSQKRNIKTKDSNTNYNNIENQKIPQRANNIQTHINSSNLNSDSFLEILVILGTGLGIAHISNSNIVYNSEGGHTVASIDDYEYLEFLKQEKREETNNCQMIEISFDDIISSTGLEKRYYYDTSTYMSSQEIITHALNNEYEIYNLKPTISFFMQELYYFLKDCIYFDNIITTLYLEGDFSNSCIEIMKRDYPKYYENLSKKCRIELIQFNYLHFLGGLEIIYSSL